MNQSEIARFREQQRLEEESAFLALYGPAVLLSHEAITSRIQQGGSHLVTLFKQGRSKEAFALWDAGILEKETS